MISNKFERCRLERINKLLNHQIRIKHGKRTIDSIHCVKKFCCREAVKVLSKIHNQNGYAVACPKSLSKNVKKCKLFSMTVA